MAQASSGGNDEFPRWARYVQPAVNALLVAVILGLAATYMLASGTAKTVETTITDTLKDHSSRIVKVEDKLSRQDVLAEKIDSANRQMDELKQALRETNQRLDADRDRRRDSR